MAQHKIPLNLPHAGRVASRIAWWLDAHLDADNLPTRGLFLTSKRLTDLLMPYVDADENPAPEVAAQVREDAARFGRHLVNLIEQHKLGEDRLGQFIRNLFECLELADEGATLSLRAGENPDSLMRPY